MLQPGLRTFFVRTPAFPSHNIVGIFPQEHRGVGVPRPGLDWIVGGQSGNIWGVLLEKLELRAKVLRTLLFRLGIPRKFVAILACRVGKSMISNFFQVKATTSARFPGNDCRLVQPPSIVSSIMYVNGTGSVDRHCRLEPRSVIGLVPSCRVVHYCPYYTVEIRIDLITRKLYS